MASTAAHRSYVIAEMACSHDGSEAHARTIIDGAGAAGADAIQFQVWRWEDMVVPGHKDREVLERIQLSPEVWTRLYRHVRETYPSMEVISCVYERESLAFCASLGVDAYKIHASDISNPDLLQATARTGKRIDLSVGGCTLDEITQAIDTIREVNEDAEIWIMYGLQAFPTPPEDIDLARLVRLRDLYGLPVGYQDHTGPEGPEAFWLPAAAHGMGVRIHEKHITHDRAKKGVDHQAALDPDEFADFTRMIRLLDQATGDGRPRALTAREREYRTYSRKSLVTLRAVAAGEAFDPDAVSYRRAEPLGLPPSAMPRVVGRKAARDLPAFHPLQEEDLA